ncbi:MAG: NAD(+) synthase [Syntrophotaleaceae bacterium]
MQSRLSSHGFVRIGVVTPEHRVADIDFNCDRIRQVVEENDNCRFFLFPELCVTAYTCGDLFFQSLLISRARRALLDLAEFSGMRQVTLVVGAPVAQGGRLFNCAVFISCGSILGIVPKIFLPNTNEFYEERWFSSGLDRTADHVEWDGTKIPFGEDLLFRAEELPDCIFGIEICEDLWVADPPSGRMAGRGATVLLNPSASPEILGKMEYRRELVRNQSGRCLAAYLYASAGPGESSTDLVYSGHSLIAENGALMAETRRFEFGTQFIYADIDIERLINERHKNNSFGASGGEKAYRLIDFPLPEVTSATLRRFVPTTPFVPPAEEERAHRCHEIFSIQTTGLAKRLRHVGTRRAVLGISGGLDSTLALLVTVKAFDKLGYDRSGIEAITMPGFGTTSRTRSNAERLAEHLGVSLRVISIDAAVRQHFADIGHDEQVHDVTYENAQARERTQILMNVANQVGGLLIGTGDLSELALGWCTYNADHMSMYGVNSGVPKTLVRYLVAWCAEAEFTGEAAEILFDVCDTPVSPELLPPHENGEIKQRTEDKVGPYLLHDFFLFHCVRLQFGPRKIFFLARHAFAGSFADDILIKWLKIFYRRFFMQQFKRSCLPDGPKVGSVVLTPRGDWRMPSDAGVALWLKELDELEAENLEGRS